MKISELGQLVSSEIIWIKNKVGKDQRYKIGVFQDGNFRTAYMGRGIGGVESASRI